MMARKRIGSGFGAVLLLLSQGAFSTTSWADSTASTPSSVSPPDSAPSSALAPATHPSPKLKLEDLGNQRLRYGTVEIDKGKSVFSVPGKLIRTNPPLEYLAVKRNGSKAYEALIELDVTAVQFNFACILIGLDAGKAKRPQFHFDKAEPGGDAVNVLVSWEKDGKETRIPASELLVFSGKGVETNNWVYTGSGFLVGNRYLAELDGTLIGFVHDPASIIEHKEGVGLGNWGSVSLDPKHQLEVGSPITMIIERIPIRDAAEPK